MAKHRVLLADDHEGAPLVVVDRDGVGEQRRVLRIAEPFRLEHSLLVEAVLRGDGTEAALA